MMGFDSAKNQLRPSYYRVVVKAIVTSLGFNGEDGTRHDVEVECFDVIEALGFDASFNLGNVLKYLWRAGRKTPDALEDLKKARTYLDREIEQRGRGAHREAATDDDDDDDDVNDVNDHDDAPPVSPLAITNQLLARKR